MKKLLLIPIAFVIVSCSETKKSSENNEMVQTDTIKAEESIQKIEKTVKGKVMDIQNGKDGYTAKIETADKEIYFVTISHSNLKDHETYKTVKVGDDLDVSGELWDLSGEQHITVREIL